MLRVSIVDTNVLVAGMITRSPSSPPVLITDAMLQGRLLYVLSAELLIEYRRVLLRPNLQKLHRLTEEQIDTVLTDITANSIWLEVTARSRHQAPDLGDNHLWALQSERPDAFLITGDRLLLEADNAHGPVISPADFCLMVAGL